MAPAPRHVKELPGAGRVYDWRGTGLLPPNGGRIKPLVFVEHIPVIRNVPGTGDFITLANVLKAQGLSLQCATDAEGNVALYNSLNRLCYQARGANQVSAGCEHMHYSTSEPWTRRQLRAAGWLWYYAREVYGIPDRKANLGAGVGMVRVLRTGHTSHQEVSTKAGFNDRSDPGALFDWGYVQHACRYWARKRTFKGC